MRICVPALVGILSCVAVAVFGQNPDLAGTWKRTQTDSSAICKIEQTDASISLNLKTHFQAGELSGWSNGTETYTPDGVERETEGRHRAAGVAHGLLARTGAGDPSRGQG